MVRVWAPYRHASDRSSREAQSNVNPVSCRDQSGEISTRLSPRWDGIFEILRLRILLMWDRISEAWWRILFVYSEKTRYRWCKWSDLFRRQRRECIVREKDGNTGDSLSGFFWSRVLYEGLIIFWFSSPFLYHRVAPTSLGVGVLPPNPFDYAFSHAIISLSRYRDRDENLYLPNQTETYWFTITKKSPCFGRRGIFCRSFFLTFLIPLSRSWTLYQIFLFCKIFIPALPSPSRTYTTPERRRGYKILRAREMMS